MSYVPQSAPHTHCYLTNESFDVLRRENRLVRTPCSHLFDRVALERFMSDVPCCPLCRRNVAIVEIRSASNRTFLEAIGQMFWAVTNFLWQGILFALEIGVASQRYNAVHTTKYVSSSRSPAYVPPRTYVDPDAMKRSRQEHAARDIRATYVPAAGAHVPLGSREEPKPSGSSAAPGVRIPLGTRAKG